MDFVDALFFAFIGLGLLIIVCLVGYVIYLVPLIGVVIFGVALVVVNAALVIYKVSNR